MQLTPISSRPVMIRRLREAEERGYYRGLTNKHYEPRTYETGAEYLAWLKGWRRGQADLYAQQRELSARMDQYERSFAAIEQELFFEVNLCPGKS